MSKRKLHKNATMTKAERAAHGRKVKLGRRRAAKAAKAGNAHHAAIAGGLGEQIKARVSTLVHEAIDAEINRLLSE